MCLGEEPIWPSSWISSPVASSLSSPSLLFLLMRRRKEKCEHRARNCPEKRWKDRSSRSGMQSLLWSSNSCCLLLFPRLFFLDILPAPRSCPGVRTGPARNPSFLLGVLSKASRLNRGVDGPNFMKVGPDHTTQPGSGLSKPRARARARARATSKYIHK